MTPEGFDQVRQIKEDMNKSRGLVDSGIAHLGEHPVMKRPRVKPISIQEVISGKHVISLA